LIFVLVHHTEENARSVSSVHLLNVLFTHGHLYLTCFWSDWNV